MTHYCGYIQGIIFLVQSKFKCDLSEITFTRVNNTLYMQSNSTYSINSDINEKQTEKLVYLTTTQGLGQTALI